MSHWNAAKRVLRYLKGTRDMGPVYRQQSPDIHAFVGFKYSGPKDNKEVINRRIVAFTDADFGGTPADRRSTSGYINMLCGSVISWFSKIQPTVALSTLEAEYMAMSSGCQDVIWARQLLNGIKEHQDSATIIYGDNQGCLAMATSSKLSNQVKHIDIRHHFLREKIESKVIAVKYCSTKVMLADILTKSVSRDQFVVLRHGLGLRSLSDL